MSTALGTSRGEQTPLRDLLATDRRLIGQARRERERAQAPLRTIAYQQPLSVRLRRRWRSDRALRIRIACVGFSLLLLALGFALQRRAQAALPAAPRGVQAEEATERGAHAAATSLRSAPVDPVAMRATDADGAQAEGLPASTLSAIRRLQRADLLLRAESPEAARAARTLLESALDELPGSVHGQVALAEACFRLGDEACARTAIHKAVLARPWRSKYRALACDIDRSFASAALADAARTAPGKALPAAAGVERLSCSETRPEAHRRASSRR
jgi:hypothetical protein